MQGHCAISNIVYGMSVCTDDNHSLKLVAYRPVHTDEPYIKLHFEHKKKEIHISTIYFSGIFYILY